MAKGSVYLQAMLQSFLLNHSQAYSQIFALDEIKVPQTSLTQMHPNTHQNLEVSISIRTRRKINATKRMVGFGIDD